MSFGMAGQSPQEDDAAGLRFVGKTLFSKDLADGPHEHAQGHALSWPTPFKAHQPNRPHLFSEAQRAVTQGLQRSTKKLPSLAPSARRSISASPGAAGRRANVYAGAGTRRPRPATTLPPETETSTDAALSRTDVSHARDTFLHGGSSVNQLYEPVCAARAFARHLCVCVHACTCALIIVFRPSRSSDGRLFNNSPSPSRPLPPLFGPHLVACCLTVGPPLLNTQCCAALLKTCRPPLA